MSLTKAKKGTLFVVAAASGTGKTSLVRRLLENQPSLQLSTSHTTRAPRSNEIDGEHYFFVSHVQFEQMCSQDSFIESAKVYNNYYGTSAAYLDQCLAQGKDIILEIDWQGARQIKARCAEAVTIFILPPSFAELSKRLHKRGQDSDDVIQRRLDQAYDEMSHFDEFDYWLVNDDFDKALQQLSDIVAMSEQTNQSNEIQ